MWTKAKDKVLALLSRKLINRNLFRIEISDKPFDELYIDGLRQKVTKAYGISADDAPYFVFTGEVANNAYNPYFDRIHILYKDNTVMDITESSDQLNINILSKTIRKYFLCYPKNL